MLCAEKPTVTLLKRVAAELPLQLKQISEEHQYTVTMAPKESAVFVADDTITVKVFLTSPLLRDPQGMHFEFNTFFCIYFKLQRIIHAYTHTREFCFYLIFLIF